MFFSLAKNAYWPEKTFSANLTTTLSYLEKSYEILTLYTATLIYDSEHTMFMTIIVKKYKKTLLILYLLYGQ